VLLSHELPDGAGTHPFGEGGFFQLVGSGFGVEKVHIQFKNRNYVKNVDFFARSRLSRECAEAWYPKGINSATPHKKSRRLTQRLRKSRVLLF
jgi:hypothetical protein